jgi:hypothetical protein
LAGELGVEPAIRQVGTGCRLIAGLRNADSPELGQHIGKGRADPGTVRHRAVVKLRQPDKFEFQPRCRVVEAVEGREVVPPVNLRAHRQNNDLRRQGKRHQPHKRRNPEPSPQKLPCHDPIHYR